MESQAVRLRQAVERLRSIHRRQAVLGPVGIDVRVADGEETEAVFMLSRHAGGPQAGCVDVSPSRAP